jgi:hypothetical protein
MAAMATSQVEPDGHGLIVLPLNQTEDATAQWIAEHGTPNVEYVLYGVVPEYFLLTENSIVAVHGLGGHRYTTWTSGNTMWLQDLLPSKLPRARIMTFGYNADVVNNFSTFGIRDHARKLLSLLRNKRDTEDTSDRPIVFICHSLGGIVVKQALRTATNESIYNNTAEKTRGIVFLGTPHRGSDLAFWGGFLARVAELAFQHPKKKFIEDLKNNSDTLMNVSEDFRSIVEKYAIISFYEENQYKVVGKEVSARSHSYPFCWTLT